MAEKLAYSIKEAVEVVPWGMTKMYELINSGELPTRFQHGHRYIMAEDLVAFLTKVPVEAPESAANAA